MLSEGGQIQRSHTEWFHLSKITRIRKSTDRKKNGSCQGLWFPQEKGKQLLNGDRVCFAVMKMFWNWIVNKLNATELFNLKWLILCHTNFTTIFLKRRGILTDTDTVIYLYRLTPHFYLKMYVERWSIGHYGTTKQQTLVSKKKD